jgi:hypothetical protein
VVEGPAPFGISESALTAFVRIVTDSRIFKQATPMSRALEFADWLREQPRAVLVAPGPRHWGLFEGFCRRPGIHGPLVTDAWFAALAIEHGCEWVTLDRDCARFPGLRVSSPVE